METDSHGPVRRLFGAALQLSPEKVATTFVERNKNPDDIAGQTVEVVRQHIKNRSHDDPEIIDDGLTFIFAGVRDTYSIMSTSLVEAKITTKETALTIADHDTTAHTIAALALRPEDQLHQLITKQGDGLGQIFGINNTDEYIELKTPLQYYGTPGSCPFAGHDKIVAPEPIFTSFAKWAGKLSVARYYQD